MTVSVKDILLENDKRNKEFCAPFNPVTGEGSIGDRVKLTIPDYELPEAYVPREMVQEPLVKKIKKAGGLVKFVEGNFADFDTGLELTSKALLKIRSKHDFPFWAYTFVKIKNKKGGPDIRFRLNRPQRRLVAEMERLRLSGRPINIILLKARQWGGSTVVQVYFAWIQLVHKRSWNSTIASHVNTVSATVRGMYTKLMKEYPTWMLYPVGSEFEEKDDKMQNFEGQQSIQYIPSRDSKLRIATANAQENLRSEDVSMVHCTEVALWPDTKLLHPEDFVDACMSGMLRDAYTSKVLESTAKGSGNYFHREWVDAKKGISDYTPVFVSWREIENDRIEFGSEEEKRRFAQWLIDNKEVKEATDRRSESGSYLWRQWEQGATLEGLHWYVEERKSKSSHDHMASEAPSDDLEAFSATGEDLFDRDNVEQLRSGCKPPKYIGEVQGSGNKGKAVLEDIRFREDKAGQLWIWSLPEHFEGEVCKDRYLVTVDIGGTHHAADWSVISVLDRYWMMEDGKPTIVAQWYGHIDHDILAWKAAQIAKYYCDARLAVESNTLDKERDVNADVSEFILNRVKNIYPNLYERQAKEEDIKEGIPVRYGWHTNRETKPKIIKGLQEAVRDMMYVERDERCLDEMLTYEHNGNKYEAKQGYHDDLLMTRAIGLWVCFNEMPVPQMIPEHYEDVSEFDMNSLL